MEAIGALTKSSHCFHDLLMTNSKLDEGNQNFYLGKQSRVAFVLRIRYM